MQHEPTFPFRPRKKLVYDSEKRSLNLMQCGPGKLVRLNPKLLFTALLLCVLVFSGCQDGQLRTTDGMIIDPLDHPSHTGSTNTFKTYPERK